MTELEKIKKEMRETLLARGMKRTAATALIYKVCSEVPEIVGRFSDGAFQWIMDGEVDIDNLSELNLFLKFLNNCETGEFFDKHFNNLSFAEMKEMFELELDAEDIPLPDNPVYKVVSVPTYESLQRFERWTKDWCITASDLAFEEYTCNGNKSVFLLVRSDYRNVPKKPMEKFPTDNYGPSICCLIVNSDGTIDSITNRWNAEDKDPKALEKYFARMLLDLEKIVKQNILD